MDNPSRYKIGKVGRVPGDLCKRGLIDLMENGWSKITVKGKTWPLQYHPGRTIIKRALLGNNERARLKERFRDYVKEEMT